jgi:hypothetical protein
VQGLYREPPAETRYAVDEFTLDYTTCWIRDRIKTTDLSAISERATNVIKKFEQTNGFIFEEDKCITVYKIMILSFSHIINLNKTLLAVKC